MGTGSGVIKSIGGMKFVTDSDVQSGRELGRRGNSPRAAPRAVALRRPERKTV